MHYALEQVCKISKTAFQNSDINTICALLTHSHTKRFSLFQTKRVCRRQF